MKQCNTKKIYLIRHGETEWALNGQHTGTTDIPLTKQGEVQAQQLQKPLSRQPFEAVLCSPLQRAQQTCKLAGLSSLAKSEPLLVEWNYGDYEGLTTATIHQNNPHWTIFTEGAPHGESPLAVHIRAKRLLSLLQPLTGNIALFSHGHFLRALTTVWLELPIEKGALFFLAPATISILGFERDQPVIIQWNASYALT